MKNEWKFAESLKAVAVGFFEKHGFRVIYGTQDDIYMLHPTDAAEAVKYGTALFSPRAMEAIGETLSEF